MQQGGRTNDRIESITMKVKRLRGDPASESTDSLANGITPPKVEGSDLEKESRRDFSLSAGLEVEFCLTVLPLSIKWHSSPFAASTQLSSLKSKKLPWLMALNEPNPDCQNSRNRNKKSWRRALLLRFFRSGDPFYAGADFRLAFSSSDSLPNP
ncbi:hypothetical protein OIU84_022289 [Salix udensis]|uniref:Uncharacterized protein n=1 Tax=Salix udensis TaxID=889485 RepID=A0AAD6KNG1_9ROSI|nr:hypothetical protein OIU84_022289 [Salix udensis]